MLVSVVSVPKYEIVHTGRQDAQHSSVDDILILFSKCIVLLAGRSRQQAIRLCFNLVSFIFSQSCA